MAKRALAGLTALAIAVGGVLPSAHATNPRKIALLYDVGGRGDRSINDSAAIGVDAAKKKFHIDPLDMREMVTDGTEKDRLRRLRFLVRAHYSTIIAVGNAYAKSVRTVSIENPDLDFAILDDASISMLSVESFAFDSQQLSFLAGVIAGGTTKSKKVGILQPTSSTVNEAAFARGVRFANPKAIAFSALPTTPNPDAEVDRLHGLGVDVIYSTWESTNDVVTRMSELSTKSNPLKLVGVLPDQYFLQTTGAKKMLVGTVNKAFNKASFDAISAAISGTSYSEVFDEGTAFGLNYTVANKGIDATVTALGAPAARILAQAKSALLTGKITFTA